MAKYKIGVTEAGDAGLDLSWVNKMDSVDGAIVITKCVSPAFLGAALKYKDKLIVHATVTGYGHTVLEPNVPAPNEEFEAVEALVNSGFPKNKVVIRVDPIIPTKKGITKAENVFLSFIDAGYRRFRFSIIDMYPHVIERFKDAQLPLPYGYTGFSPSAEQIKAVDDMIRRVKDYWYDKFDGDYLYIECCAEPGIHNAEHCGCVSDHDLYLLGLEDDDGDFSGYQRVGCMCYAGKTELLSNKRRCPHKCLYCYWR